MVLAGRRGDERLGESQRRLGMMRIATKYPRIAERYFEDTGRQIELIEVKGSVELAPLIGSATASSTSSHGARWPRTTSRYARRSSTAPRDSSPTGSPTSCAPPKSTT